MDHQTHKSRNELARAARAGDLRAQGRLYEALRPHALISARRFAHRARRHAQAEDLVQIAWMSLAQSLSSLPADCSYQELKIYFMRILRHRTIDTTRNHRRSSGESELDIPLSERADAGPADRSVTKADFSRTLWLRVSEALPDKFSMIVRLRHLENCSFAEIGRRLGISECAARQRHTRAVLALRKRLAAFDDRS